MNIVFFLNPRYTHTGIYLFIAIENFLFGGRTAGNEPCLFLIFSFIISAVCMSMHIIYMEQGRYRELPSCFSRFFARFYFPTFPTLLFHGTFRFVLSSQFNKT